MYLFIVKEYLWINVPVIVKEYLWINVPVYS